jgi:hypothetical protein
MTMKRAVFLILLIAISGCTKKEPVQQQPQNSSTLHIEPVANPSGNTPKDIVFRKVAVQPEAKNISSKSGTAQDFMEDMKKPPQPCPILSLEDFFEGNNDLGSIGCNLTPHPGIKIFYSVLKQIRERSNVQTVLIEISQGEYQYSDWVFSESLYVITSASKQEVEDWLKPLQPDEVGEGWSAGKPSAAPEVKEGMKIYWAWWD